jgi:acetylornithine deacetylase/succinyl-diaminopimelate desuccinylase-like protein
MAKVRTLSAEECSALETLPYNEALFRKQAKILERARIIGGNGSVYEKMWYRPSLAVNAIEASSRKQAANIINDIAWARIGIRIVPDMDPEETLKLFTDHLKNLAPWGVQVTIVPETPSPWWKGDATGPVFQAALGALEKGFGRKAVITGAGGSIPFVQTITEALGGAPALLVGVGDPFTAAHSENESLLLSDWEKGCRSIIHLLADLDRLNG